MKRMFAFAALLGALSVVAALVSTSASAVSSASPNVPGNIGGVVPVKGKQGPFLGIPLVYHGGPVMLTNKTYAIYWKPAGYSMASGYDTTINQYFTDVAHDSGMGSNVYAAATQYYQNPGSQHIQYSSTFGGSFTDTNPFPASGCPLYNGLPVCLTDAQIQTEIDNVISSQGWVRNGTNQFFVFTAQNVGSCFDSSGSECAFTVYCAYHGTSNSGAIYANMPYTGGVGGCDEGQYPNGSSNQADPTINVTSHEHNEAITDPQLNAWYDNQGAENGDKCAWNFGQVSGSNGAEYNQTINGHHYFLQMEWSNSAPTNSCVQTYSIGGGGGGPPSISSFSPTSGPHGITVTINGNNLNGTTRVSLIRNFAVYNSPFFTVVSNTQLKATVPSAGRGLARWRITTPKGTATSTTYFNVTG
jgi:IPT/TIG domain